MTEQAQDKRWNAGRSAVAVSVVTSGHGQEMAGFVDDLERCCDPRAIRLIVTVNVPESLPFEPADCSFPVTIRRNLRPLGFAANHNAAYASVQAPYFCVANPDIRLVEDPFPALLSSLASPEVGVVAPLVQNSRGAIADSVRRLPTPPRLVSRLLRGSRSEYQTSNRPLPVEWVAGMFMLFPSSTFEELHGFDHRFFLYYEDVDLCTRLRLAGYRVVLNPSTSVIHDAKRRSHEDLKHFWWHATSTIRFFTSPVFFRALRQ